VATAIIRARPVLVDSSIGENREYLESVASGIRAETG
jgi:hypothetical protein